ncbi:S-protein homolog 29-like [Diospyros lotus]|uniref:S-protein homolog 29-like n=1 Tax=Diospyros lotus TaxID=55363 RepID=UPI0022598B2D|nr:S-protein homolog 29-like [Diospyros lotus]
MLQRAYRSWSLSKIMSQFFLPSIMLLTIACFISSTSCDHQDEAMKAFFRKTAVRVFNNVSGLLIVRCQSKDDDIGVQTLRPNQNLTWRFRPHVFPANTLFFCHFYWGFKDQIFDVYNNYIDDFCTHRHSKDYSCYWSVRPDGFYFSGTNYAGSYVKWHDWKNRSLI